VRYEGFGVGGVAVIVEALTDNRNRTAPEVRSTFTKFGGNLGELGSVSFMFERVGKLFFKKSVASFDKIFEAAAESGANDCEKEEGSDEFEITCDSDVFGVVRDDLTQKFGDPFKSEIVWGPKNFVECNLDTLKTVLKMIDVLEDNEDVQNVFSNWTCNDDVQQALNKESE
jgi:YebC/PmpR family DNA-binding regulatory protein